MRITLVLLALALGACAPKGTPVAPSGGHAFERCLAGDPRLDTALSCLRERGYLPLPDTSMPGRWTFSSCVAASAPAADCLRVIVTTDQAQAITGWTTAPQP